MAGGIVRESGMDVDTRLCLIWRTSKDLLSSTGKSAQCHVAAGMGGEFMGEWIHAYVCLSPFTVPLKLSHHCYLARLQRKIKSQEKALAKFSRCGVRMGEDAPSAPGSYQPE